MLTELPYDQSKFLHDIVFIEKNITVNLIHFSLHSDFKKLYIFFYKISSLQLSHEIFIFYKHNNKTVLVLPNSILFKGLRDYSLQQRCFYIYFIYTIIIVLQWFIYFFGNSSVNYGLETGHTV